MSHIRKIIVPMDGSPPSLAALAEAVTFAEELGADIDVLHVNAPDDFEVGSTTAVAKAAQSEAERDMEEGIATAKARFGDRLTQTTVSGDPIHEILKFAADRADLIIMGTHGRVGRLRARVGSVAEGVVRNSPCPVLTVRHPDGEEESFEERIHHRPTASDHVRSPR